MTPRARTAGFTMVELVVVMILVGVLAAIGIPRLMGDKGMQAAVFGDQVVSGLRRAQKIATGHRRVVCATVGTQAVILRLNACDATGLAIGGVDDGDFATTDSALTATPAVTLYFQPDGRITSDAAGTTAVTAAIAIAGASGGQTTTVRTINVEGSTGYVE
ncbi:prepilin-type N-terminal cleavage/methylation domain-containing protein [Massilia pinisoli]|uniref:Prepilin-type N-terminal cleavage/methylation domain-containing protein n=1 Tax=Massilia pinisoli TaxID=1772194 RepID=A0ABT1ZJH2_9BURK|nr:prepilin-type N-terminal cleavage/methylation domain-containing protein [Massilia pinisoli]MCS0580062.1 prepilin-type N-terminal cleavage/methylation domain-containing protein [Massilia pinisoli]